ncbi:MAG: lipoprotein-releasing ABC transporter permease subunit [Rubrivivax sp.]
MSVPPPATARGGAPFEWQIGWRYLRGQRRGGFVSFIALLSVVGITLGVAALIVVLSVMNGFQQEVRERMLDVIGHAEAIAVGPQPADLAALQATLSRDADVTGAAPYAAVQGLLGRGERMRGVWVNGIEPAQEVQVTSLARRLGAGEQPLLARLQPGRSQVLLGAELARALQLKPGDSVALVLPPPEGARPGQATTAEQAPEGATARARAPRTLTLQVAGTFETGHYQYDEAWALMHRADVLSLSDGRAQQGVRLRLKDPDQAPTVSRRLATAVQGSALVRDWTDSNRHWFAAVAQQKRMLGLILTLIVAVAAFNLVSTLVMTVTDKRADIAILRTLGASPGSVMGIFVVQGAMAGLIGTVGGVALGLLVSLNIDVIVPAIERLLGTSLLPGNVDLLSKMPSLPLASDIVPIALVSMALALLSTLYPSWRASRVEPAEALRHEA